MGKAWLVVAFMAVFVFTAAGTGYASVKAKITTETFYIASSDPGIKLYVRNKYLSGAKMFAGEKIILFVHGASYPSETVFDLDLPGGSWMDYAAARGYDTYMLDIRGYGLSTRPPAMDAPPDKNPAFATTADAWKDVGAAVDFILKRRNVSRINLVGWSWGTTLMGGFAGNNNDKVVKLVLYAPLWCLKEPPPFSGTGAYRNATKESARARALSGIPAARREEISPQAWFDKWWEANLASDPAGARQTPPVVRAPNGVLQDITQFWGKGKPMYDPSLIKVPTLLIVGEWDQDTPLFMAQEVFARLANTPYKREEILAEGTHMIAVEKNRMDLIKGIQRFLDERR